MNEGDYIIQPGDTLQKIARRLYKDVRRWQEIADLNGMTYPFKIQPGKKLKLPPQ
jgi:nucleoid-associated protein YgaU